VFAAAPTFGSGAATMGGGKTSGGFTGGAKTGVARFLRLRVPGSPLAPPAFGSGGGGLGRSFGGGGGLTKSTATSAVRTASCQCGRSPNWSAAAIPATIASEASAEAGRFGLAAYTWVCLRFPSNALAGPPGPARRIGTRLPTRHSPFRQA